MKLTWDQAGGRLYETGVSNAVLYLPDESTGAYSEGYAWNGVTAITESPSGAEASPQYADNIKYLNLTSAEEFGATLEAFTWPEEFDQCDGSVSVVPGLTIGQQNRRPFGLSYITKLGNDTVGDRYGQKLHIIYGAQAAPTEKAYATVNDSPEATTFSWELTTTAVDVPGFNPTALVTLNSTLLDKANWEELLSILHGSESNEPRLPLPNELFELLGYAGAAAGSGGAAAPAA